MLAQDKPIWAFTLVAGVSGLVIGYAIWRTSATGGRELPKRSRKPGRKDDPAPLEEDEPKDSTDTDLPAVPPISAYASLWLLC